MRRGLMTATALVVLPLVGAASGVLGGHILLRVMPQAITQAITDGIASKAERRHLLGQVRAAEGMCVEALASLVPPGPPQYLDEAAVTECLLMRLRMEGHTALPRPTAVRDEGVR